MSQENVEIVLWVSSYSAVRRKPRVVKTQSTPTTTSATNASVPLPEATATTPAAMAITVTASSMYASQRNTSQEAIGESMRTYVRDAPRATTTTPAVARSDLHPLRRLGQTSYRESSQPNPANTVLWPLELEPQQTAVPFVLIPQL